MWTFGYTKLFQYMPYKNYKSYKSYILQKVEMIPLIYRLRKPVHIDVGVGKQSFMDSAHQLTGLSQWAKPNDVDFPTRRLHLPTRYHSSKIDILLFGLSLHNKYWKQTYF